MPSRKKKDATVRTVTGGHEEKIVATVIATVTTDVWLITRTRTRDQEVDRADMPAVQVVAQVAMVAVDANKPLRATRALLPGSDKLRDKCWADSPQSV